MYHINVMRNSMLHCHISTSFSRLGSAAFPSRSPPNHVSDTPNRGDHFPLVPGIDLLPEVIDHHVDNVGPRVEMIPPGILGDERAAHDAPLVPHEILEHGVLLRRQLDRFTRPG